MRIQQRLKMQSSNQMEVLNFLTKAINNSTEVVKTHDYLYVKIAKSNLYIVISNNNVILTVTPISAGKMLAIIEED